MSKLNTRLLTLGMGLTIGLYVFMAYGIQTAFRQLPVASEGTYQPLTASELSVYLSSVSNGALLIDYSGTKVNPDYQAQRALAVQGTVGVE